MALFDSNRSYQPSDPEILDLLGSKDKQAQMRYYGRSPSYYRLGRKIIYHGLDLNAWAEANRIDPGNSHFSNGSTRLVDHRHLQNDQRLVARNSITSQKRFSATGETPRFQSGVCGPYRVHTLPAD